MKQIFKTFLCISLSAVLLCCVCACGKDTSGLGTLKIDETADDGTLEPLGGSDGTETTSGQDSDPVPETTSAPETEADSGTEFQVESFSCDYFECYIPAGWNVDYNVYDAGGGNMRVYIFIQDPTDANNIVFYAVALEPFFTSTSDKNAAVSVLGSAYEWSPVLSELSAEGVLEQWSSVYSLMDATSFVDGVKYFKNYSIVSVLDSQIADGSSTDVTTSQVLAEVTIPGASSTYGFLFGNTLRRGTYAVINTNYYISYDNRGFVISADRFEAEAEGLAYCATSFDFTKFNNKYNSATGVAADENYMPASNLDITLPDVQVFAGK